jgi:acyl dehydratase
MAMREFKDLDEFTGATGEVLGVSDWITVTQQQIDQFADATNDHQWIHVNRERAARSPFGTTIAHGYLTLSLIPTMAHRIYSVGGVPARLNYGSNRVRFPAPVPCGSRLRTKLTLLSTARESRGLRAISLAEVERDGYSRPVCIAEIITLFLTAV